jgi:hypothetical protein
VFESAFLQQRVFETSVPQQVMFDIDLSFLTRFEARIGWGYLVATFRFNQMTPFCLELFTSH